MVGNRPGDTYNISDVVISWHNMDSRGRFFTVDISDDLDWSKDGDTLVNSGTWTNMWTIAPNGWDANSNVSSAIFLHVLSANTNGGEAYGVSAQSASPSYAGVATNAQGVLGAITGPKSGNGRYVRIYVYDRGNYGATSRCSIWEVEVFGQPDF